MLNISGSIKFYFSNLRYRKKFTTFSDESFLLINGICRTFEIFPLSFHILDYLPFALSIKLLSVVVFK